METLVDKIALITGGGSGINLAFAQLLVANGCTKILIADLTLHPQAQQWLSTLPSTTTTTNPSQPQTQVQVPFHHTDVTSWPSLAASLDACEHQFGGPPDIVIPGAGIYEPSSNSFWGDEDDMQASRYKVLDVNLVHPIKLTRMAVQRMLRAGKREGIVVCVSSVAGQRSSLVTPLYTASKHGVNSFVRGLGVLEELVGIRVAAVAPGPVMTPLWTDHPQSLKFIDKDADFMLPPEEVARAMLALVMDKKYKSGTILEVCDVEGRWREAHLLNDPGPSGPAVTTSRKPFAIKEIMQILNAESGGELNLLGVNDDAVIERLLK